MKTRRTLTTAFVALLAWTTIQTATAQGKGSNSTGKKGRDAALYESNRAVILVTGMRLDENPESYTKDLSVAEGATVKVTTQGWATREKKTEAFIRGGRKGGSPEKHFTADFEVDLDTTYAITMTFKDGTVIRIEDYTLPKSWKTHFYFHSTTGTKSPASVLRFVEDPKTKLRCCVYAVYPLENYRRLGGQQVQ